MNKSNGHPAPVIEFDENNVVFLCKDEFEQFVPNTDEKIQVTRIDLLKAYEGATLELKEFEKKLNRIETDLSYKPKNDSLANILIYRNQEIDIEEIKKLCPTMHKSNGGESAKSEVKAKNKGRSWLKRLWS